MACRSVESALFTQKPSVSTSTGQLQLIGNLQAARVRKPCRPCCVAAPTKYPSSGDEVKTTELKRFGEQQVQDLNLAFKSQHKEFAYWVDEAAVEGEIPKELEGTLLQNGVGLFEIGDQNVDYPFDGDGMVSMFAFKDGRVFFRNKFIRTEGFLKEQRAGKMLYRGLFTIGNPSGLGWLNPFSLEQKNLANTSVLHWGGKTLALHEVGLPHELDKDLSTIGLSDFGGMVDPTGSESRVCAHYRIFEEADGSNRLCGAIMDGQGLGVNITFVEFDEDFKPVQKRTQPLPGGRLSILHDLSVTENYYILIDNNLNFDAWHYLTKYLPGEASFVSCTSIDKSARKVYLIPRPGRLNRGPYWSPETRVFEISPQLYFHQFNSYEFDNGRYVVVDTVGSDDMDFGIQVSKLSPDLFTNKRTRPACQRVVFDLLTGKTKQGPLIGRSVDGFFDLNPALSGRPHQFTFVGCSGVVNEDIDGLWGPNQGIMKVSVGPSVGAIKPLSRSEVTEEVWWAGPRCFAMEPHFVPKVNAKSEDDGWVLVPFLNGETQTSDLIILDGMRISDGPVATIHLPHHIPWMVHGSFTPEYLGPAEVGKGGSEPYDIRNGV